MTPSITTHDNIDIQTPTGITIIMTTSPFPPYVCPSTVMKNTNGASISNPQPLFLLLVAAESRRTWPGSVVLDSLTDVQPPRPSPPHSSSLLGNPKPLSCCLFCCYCCCCCWYNILPYYRLLLFAFSYTATVTINTIAFLILKTTTFFSHNIHCSSLP